MTAKKECRKRFAVKNHDQYQKQKSGRLSNVILGSGAYFKVSRFADYLIMSYYTP